MTASRFTAQFEIEELRIPATLDGPDGAAFTAVTEVSNVVSADTLGTDEVRWTPTEMLAQFHDKHRPMRVFAATVDDRIVGSVVHELQSGDNPRAAWITVEVLPEFRRRGIGAALYNAVEKVALADRRAVLQGFALHGSVAGETIQSPTGFGSVPLDDGATRFALARGFTLAQVDRMSRLALPVAIPDMSTPAGYELVFWDGPTPPHALDDVARLQARMSTDAPAGDTVYDEEQWDADRVRDLDETRAEEGRCYLTTAARELDSGQLVGFTELTVAPDTKHPAYNHNTLVLKEHRGHRLGMAVKLENLRHLARLAPGHPAIYTWNAEENRHMLDVNERIGFVPFAYEGSWRKNL